MKRLIKKSEVKTKQDHTFNFNKAVNDFKRKYKLTNNELKDKSQNNPYYKLWNEYMFDNYPIWSMSSVSYILRGWGYLVGTGIPFYNDNMNINNENNDSSQSSGDFTGIGDVGGEL